MFESEEALPWREPIGARRDDQRYAVHVAQVLGARLGGDEVEVLVEAWSVGLSVEGLDLEELRRLLDGDVGAERPSLPLGPMWALLARTLRERFLEVWVARRRTRLS